MNKNQTDLYLAAQTPICLFSHLYPWPEQGLAQRGLVLTALAAALLTPGHI